MSKCDFCGAEKEIALLTTIEENGEIFKVHLCEGCYDYLEKPYKARKKENE